VYPNLVNAADYGVPQDRWRVILMGLNKGWALRNTFFLLLWIKKRQFETLLFPGKGIQI
jgi:site-specific DNA-cytosine methylase